MKGGWCAQGDSLLPPGRLLERSYFYANLFPKRELHEPPPLGLVSHCLWKTLSLSLFVTDYTFCFALFYCAVPALF
jgi:hypothetical protein